MKHYSPAAVTRAARRLLTEGELQAALRAELDESEGATAALAARLGISERALSRLLRGGAVGDVVAGKLGYRKVTRFERVS